jgi:hypothetical protein
MTTPFVTRGAEARTEFKMSSDAYAWGHLLSAFESAVVDPSARAIVNLHSAVRELAMMARRERLTPERAVITLKTLLSGHGTAGWTPSLDAELTEQRPESLVYAKVFSWYLDALFEPAESTCAVDSASA